jgi:hypothetical protein
VRNHDDGHSLPVYLLQQFHDLYGCL